jgi:hypothetical protein
MKVVVVGLLLCIVLFFAGLIAPRRSRRLQRWVDRMFRKGERKANRSAGRVGDATKHALRWTRRAGDRSAAAGRKVNRKARALQD